MTKLISDDKNIEERETVPKTPLLGQVDCSKCPRFNTCSASICPLNPNRHKAVWYPDEEICKNREMVKRFRFIRVQRKIQKRAVNRDTYYTLRMLEEITGVRKETKGLSPETVSDESWITQRKKQKEKKLRNAQIRKTTIGKCGVL
ncbi:hypothetical protein [Hippea alviniae]|uniref:hypothetical protein n=1 Tax=Hippea alviniae TaxID=1279027 RepID=UPI0003B3EF0E|nr:hypothetical protein [Hippea alviniae]